MFKVSDLRELIRLVDETSIHELHIESGELTFHIAKAAVPVTQLAVQSAEPPAQVAVSAAAPTSAVAPPVSVAPQVASDEDVAQMAGTALITSPMVGTFYRSPSPTAGSYVDLGAKVTEKSVVCIVEAMKLMNEIEADVRGEIVEILAENGNLVEYGQPLFRVKLA